jgi:hypothetical protein
MAEPTLLDKTYSFIMKGLVETGQAPHYTEIAAELGVSPREGRQALRKLFSVRGLPGWLYPKVDTVVSMAPFNNLPTQYRITIDGEQKWFAQ